MPKSKDGESKKASGEQTGNPNSEQKAFEECGTKHSFCTVGAGNCKMRKGHESWGQSHVCDKCGKDF